MKTYGLVERLRNGGQGDLADMAQGVVNALAHLVRWHDQLSPEDIASAKSALLAASGAVPAQNQIAAAGIAVALDSLLTRCREDRHSPTYSDLMSVRSGE